MHGLENTCKFIESSGATKWWGTVAASLLPGSSREPYLEVFSERKFKSSWQHKNRRHQHSGLDSQTKHKCNRQCIKSHTGTVWPRPAGATNAAPPRLGLFLDKANWNTDKHGDEVMRVETPEIHSGCRGAWRKCVCVRLKARPVKPELHCNQASGPQADRYLKSSGSFTRRAGEECVSVARGLEKTVHTEEGVEVELGDANVSFNS